MTKFESKDFSLKVNNTEQRLYKFDCINGMSKLEEGSVDVVVTSPPYNLGTTYEGYDDKLERADYLNWMRKWGAAVSRVLSDKGSLFLNIGGKPSDPWGPFEVLFELRKQFELQNTIHWIKSIAIGKEDVGRKTHFEKNISIGHYKPINSNRYINDCQEYIFHLTKSGEVHLDRLAIGVEYQYKSNISRFGTTDRPDLRCRGNTWFVPYKTIKNRTQQRPHPATFPIKIPQRCIQLHGISNTKLVMDPFMGIGHTAAACMQLGVNCIGFEIANDYFEESIRMLKEISNQE